MGFASLPFPLKLISADGRSSGPGRDGETQRGLGLGFGGGGWRGVGGRGGGGVGSSSFPISLLSLERRHTERGRA